ncbi:hypothetical protein BCF46_1513 [Litoreibacter meonggei]|uniref:Uncharacterized protein n=1 Tax=Litoreibacter meonggei TaxID=1049199 RepID=A0A497X445_9RHOB|nr:hypothetical protein [Litoreibacter meonggei]RLJ59364.1 hypothetical protein BCF46_1513 [Litoreibacter meonggei]
MRVHKAPLLMGGMMGLMLPWMMHMENGGSAGFVFVLSHIALIVGIAALALFVPSVRHKLRNVKGHMAHVRLMGIGLISGLAATCAICLAIGGVHWT